MTEGTFEPLRVLAELNALGVRYVLVGDLAEAAPEVPLSADSVEICVADDDDNIDRLRILMVALDAQQEGATGDPHRAAFRTNAGRLECVEVPAGDGFVKLAAQATHLDFGNGVIARGVAAPEIEAEPWSHPVTSRAKVVVEPVDTRELIETVRAAAVAQPVQEEPEAARRARRQEADEDEYPSEPVIPTEDLKPWQKVWRAFEDIDDFLTNLDARSLRPRSRRR
jgi:hypothetical protein